MNTSDNTVAKTRGWYARPGTDPFTHWVDGVARIGNTPFNMPAVAQVHENLYHGSYVNGLDMKPHFGAIVSLYPWEKYDHPNLYEFTMYDDDQHPVDERTLERAADKTIELLSTGQKVLVHCQAGLNRSGLLTAYVLMKGKTMTADQAIELVRRKSPVVLVNSVFEDWLRDHSR